MTLTNTDAVYLNKIRNSTLETIEKVIGKSPQEVILLDTPRHRNLGDTLIWQGTIDYLEKLGHRIVHQSDLGRHRDEDLNHVSPTSPILLQGGGNMGDLYPEHDAFRRHIIRTYPKRRIIVFPQSIHYQNKESLTEAVKDYRKGHDVTLLLRESRSLSIASEEFSGLGVEFCYDVALGADLPPVNLSRHRDLLVLARRDFEVTTRDAIFDASSEDWSWSRTNGALWKFNIGFGAGYKRAPEWIQSRTYALNQIVNSNLLHLNIQAAVDQFSYASTVATNRLHAHVLAVLLGIPHVVTDNSYGKISRIYQEYSGAFTSAHWADSLIDASNRARNLDGITRPHEAI